ncbi:MAG: hypothetical protein HN478_10510 [Rhodospirillaceae bacterium]|jgi:sarcosine oxidase, subunit gamma|nr:hypothetical protein [Rhodospirillaceae bacterium]MBT5190756.1 hypothetical protein [Rhodospirillaceae bacterium]MBT5898349.1 hypothetical protein [Rhodospirillaceae bacterium]MBT6427047.1 hypothetical protein [Rhodospirillaceae bacterium]
MNQPRHDPSRHDPPRHDPLGHLALAAKRNDNTDSAGVTMRALPYRPSLILRGESDDTAFLEGCRKALGIDVPLAPGHVAGGDDFTALWLGPSEWLILGRNGRDRLAENLAGCHHALIDNGDGQQVIALSGARAGAVLSKLCPLDLGGPEMDPGRCARSVLAGIGVTIWRGDTGAFQMHVGRSFADYAWRIIADAGLEYGIVAILEDAGSDR